MIVITSLDCLGCSYSKVRERAFGDLKDPLQGSESEFVVNVLMFSFEREDSLSHSKLCYKGIQLPSRNNNRENCGGL